MFYKKVLVLKRLYGDESLPSATSKSSPSSALSAPSPSYPSACGLCRLETENGVTTVYLSFVGIPAIASAQGEYRFCVISGDKRTAVKVIGRSPVAPPFTVDDPKLAEKGVSAGLWSIVNGVPILVAYGQSADSIITKTDYSTIFLNDFIKEQELERVTQRTDDAPLPFNANESENKEDFREIQDDIAETADVISAPYYDDDALATENYYGETAEINEKLNAVKEFFENRESSDKDESENTSTVNEETADVYKKTAETDENTKSELTAENPAPYYFKVKNELDGVFARFPKEERLMKIYEGSVWAKIYYAENKYYVVGLIKENGKEKYICYGVPSVYQTTPPKELDGYCSFIPLSLFDLKGDGYFMMFQDAVTGKCIKP